MGIKGTEKLLTTPSLKRVRLRPSEMLHSSLFCGLVMLMPTVFNTAFNAINSIACISKLLNFGTLVRVRGAEYILENLSTLALPSYSRLLLAKNEWA